MVGIYLFVEQGRGSLFWHCARYVRLCVYFDILSNQHLLVVAGPIPAELGSLSVLEVLVLSGNALSGESFPT